MKMNNFSDSLVEEYELFGSVYPSHDELQRTVADALRVHFGPDDDGYGRTFLDIGAGCGFTSYAVGREFPLATFLMNDFDGDMLVRAERRLGEGYRMKRLEGDIEDVIRNIESDSVDSIYAAWVIHNFSPSKRKAIFTEIARVLKFGGVCAFMEKVGNPGEKRTRNVAEILTTYTPFVTEHGRPDLYVEWVKHDLDDEDPGRLFSDDELSALMESVGFVWKCTNELLPVKTIVAIKPQPEV